MHPICDSIQLETRRQFFASCGQRLSIGTAALATLLAAERRGPVAAATDKTNTGGLPGLPHFAPKAKRAIYLFMSGAPSQMDTFDYKPKMDDWFDKDLPESIRQGQRLTTMTSGQKRFPIAPSMFKFQQHGQSGAWVSELLPHISTIVDDIAIIKTIHTEAINHDPAITYICTGSQLPGKPSLGAWLSYGLGSENQNLPAFVVLNSTWTGRKEAQALYNRLWGSGFLASRHQGVMLRTQGDPVLFLSNPDGVSMDTRRRMLDALNQLNQKQYEQLGDPEIQTRIAQYEMAFRMQASVPELTDLSKEPESIFDLYGPDSKIPGTFAYNCLLARRMAERDVRFVQIFHRGWDQHGSLPRDLTNQCRDIDQGAAALIKDLKQRGLLDDTLVIWGGEFGRTIYCQGALSRTNYGRDHHPRCFTMWMAGGGIQGGIVHGETDDFSYNIVRDPVHIRDMNATILRQLGIDHRRLSVKFQGLDQRLTGVEEAHPIEAILA
ncbi:MAG: DUF1501 domain-containing protein [Gemmataceae bacterium]